MEQVPAQQQRVCLDAHRVLQDLLERHERVVLAQRVVLVHAQVAAEGRQA